MKWTEEIPREPGWYWLKPKPENCPYPYWEHPCVAHVTEESHGENNYIMLGECEKHPRCNIACLREEFLWAGPIPLPE